MTSVIKTLQKTALLSGVHGSVIDVIASRMVQVRNYKANDTIITDGEKGDNFFILMQGTVTVIKRITLVGDDSPMGGNKAMIRLTDADAPFFGEMAMFDKNETRSATVVAVTDCALLEVDAKQMVELAASNADFGVAFYRNVSHVLAVRLRKANSDIMKLTTALSIALED